MKTKTEQIAKLLNLKTSEPMNPDVYGNIVIDKNLELTLYHDTYRKKLNVGVTYAKATGLSYSTFYGEHFDKISVNPEKSPEAIAKDITRRILNTSSFELYKINVSENIARMKKENSLKAEIAADIAALKELGVDFFAYQNDHSRSLTINTDCGRVELAFDRIPVKKLVKILSIIDTELKLVKYEEL